MTKQEQIQTWTSAWTTSGVSAGDTLLLHSSVSRTLRAAKANGVDDIQPRDILESFLEALGPEGTLLIPLFNFDNSKGIPFDIRSSPSKMGALTEAARLMPGAVRTGHPIYSFAVLGKNARLFDGMENESGYGPDSPFALLRELDGKIGVLNLDDQNSMTFYHHVEEMERVPYRYFKTFTMPYTNVAGSTATRSFKLFVRDIEKGVLTDVNPMGEILWQNGLYRGSRYDEGPGLRVIRARALFEAVSNVIREGKAKGTLYSIQNPS